MDTTVLAIPGYENIQWRRFHKGYNPDDDMYNSLPKAIQRGWDIEFTYASGCRESLLSQTARYLKEFEFLGSIYKGRWVKIDVHAAISNKSRKYLNYFYHFMKYYSQFRYDVRHNGVSLLMHHTAFSVPKLSFMLFFPKFNGYISNNLPWIEGRMGKAILRNWIPPILDNFGSQGVNVAFVLWLLTKHNSSSIFYIYDNNYGRSTSGISNLIGRKLSEGKYLKDFKEFNEIYNPNYMRISEQILFQLKLYEEETFANFKRERMYA